MRALLPLLALAACASRPDRTEVATFGAGCFWCAEAAFEQLDGVVDVTSGFMGGAPADPASADALIAAGHAEVVQVEFDPTWTSYHVMLDWFWRVHDPTSLNEQGEDVGPEYRSVIFVHSAAQRRAAEASRAAWQERVDRPIVTEIEDASVFHPAADRHQDYYARDREGEYQQRVIAPHLRAAGLEDGLTPR